MFDVRISFECLPSPGKSMTTTSRTTRVHRHAATEPRVRGWWLVVLGLVAAAVYIIGSQYWTWRAENWLIYNGVPITALVESSSGMRAPGSKHDPEASVGLKYEYQGVDYLNYGYLGGREEPIVVKSTVPIRIDPADPNRWTYRTEPAPLLKSFVAIWTLLPLTVLGLAGGLWSWWRMMSLYRSGRRDIAVVVDARHASLAPASRLVRCTIPTATEGERVVTVYVPRGVRPQPGDELPVIHNDKGRAVAVAWMEEENQEIGK
jgi:hypothetical protein